MSEKLKQIYLTAKKKSNPLLGKEDNKWIPILKCEDINSIFGFTEEGDWILKEKSGLILMNNPQSFSRIIILLEQPFNEIEIKITNQSKSLGLEMDINELFPYVEIISVGLNSSEYWAELAFNWFVELSIEKKILLTGSLIEAVSKKILSQQVRNKAVKELKLMGYSKDQIYKKS